MKQPSKLHFHTDTIAHYAEKLHHDDDNQDNAGVEAAEDAMSDASYAVRKLHRAASKARSEKGHSSNAEGSTAQKNQQKTQIKKQYAKEKTSSTKEKAEAASKAASAVKEKVQKTAEFIAAHKKGFLICLGSLLMFAFLLNTLSSCSVLVQGTLSSLVGATFPSADADMLAAEAQYSAMEADLQYELDHYEELHPGSDDYHYELDAIGHDPYVLISLLTAYHEGAWTIDEVQDTLTMLFEKQYKLEAIDIGTDSITTKVTLKNFDLSHLPVYVLTESQVGMYALYMTSQGNRPDLFPSGTYPNASGPLEYEDYEIPPEALEDEVFAGMITEAEKFLGYPYVWGGSSPETSFDCSGFVSWVINHSGWSVGRRSAQGLLEICTRVSSVNVKPGDLIFFEHTYDTHGASHVGIYVGGNRMIHCGNPISYTSINSSYWQSHFLAFGRLP